MNCHPPSPRRTGPSLSLAASLAALAFAPFVNGAVVLDNLSQISGAGNGSFPNYTAYREAVQVTTGSAGTWSVSSVSIIAGYMSGWGALQIWSDNSGTLGTLLATSATIPNNFSPGTNTFSFNTPVSLNASTAYWVTVAADSPTSYFTGPWQYNPNATPSSSYGWQQSASQLTTTDNGVSWSASSGRSYVSLQIDATLVSSGVPDGTTTAFLLAPIGAGLAWVGRRRSRPGQA